MGHSRRLLNSHQMVRLSDVTVSVANAHREYGANLFYRFNVSDRIPGCVRGATPQASEWQRIGDQINAAFIFARADFINVQRRFASDNQQSKKLDPHQRFSLRIGYEETIHSFLYDVSRACSGLLRSGQSGKAS
jgi:hypothetical protein